jgi:general secretion pathway protein I
LRIRVWVAAAESRRGNGSISDRAVTSLTGFVGVDQ